MKTTAQPVPGNSTTSYPRQRATQGLTVLGSCRRTHRYVTVRPHEHRPISRDAVGRAELAGIVQSWASDPVETERDATSIRILPGKLSPG